MDKFRFFRCLVCLLLVCSLCFNMATVPARASIAVSTMYGIGLAALLLLGACGVYFTATSTEQVEAIGQSWSDHMYASATTDEEVEIIDVTMGIVFEEMTNPPEDPRLTSGGWTAFFVGKALEWVKIFMEGQSPVLQPMDDPATYGVELSGGAVYRHPSIDTRTYLATGQHVAFKCTFINENNRNYRYYVLVLLSQTGRIDWHDTSGDSGTVSLDSFVLDGVTRTYYTASTSSPDDFFLSGCVDLGSIGKDQCGGSTSTAAVKYAAEAMIARYSLGQITGDTFAPRLFPDLITGGILSALQEGYKVEDIKLPDLEYGNIITEDQTLQEALTQTQTQLMDGTMTWQQYVDLLTNGNGINITIDNGSGYNDYEIKEDGVSNTPKGPEAMQPYMVDLKDFFPFCIPFDLYDFFSLLCAEPEAPVLHWELQDLAGNVYPIDIDLSPWDAFAVVFRMLQLLVFVIGLAMASRKFIKW